MHALNDFNHFAVEASNNMDNSSESTTPEFSLSGIRIFWFTFLILLAISTLLGNILLCLVVLKDRNLRIPSNIFLLNVGLGDLFCSLSTMPLDMSYLSHRETWFFGKEWNIAFDAVWLGSTLLSFINVTIIACERYFAVLHPFWYKNTMTKNLASFCCCFVWLYIAALVTGLVLFTFKTPGKKYSFLIPGYVYYPVLYFHVVVAFALMAFFYCNIFKEAKRHELEIGHLQCEHSHRKNFYLQMKATRTVGLVILLFVLVWLPFLLKQLFDTKNVFAGIFDIWNSAFVTLTYCNGAVNFFVYACRNTMIRKALVKMCRCKK